MATEHSILVLGAGELGLTLLCALKAHPSSASTRISVLLRPLPSATTPPSGPKASLLKLLSTLDIPIIWGDLIHDAPSTLVALFRPFPTIISCTGFVAGRGTQLKIAKAVLAAGVQRYFPWQFGVDYDAIGKGSAQDLFDEQLDVRDLLRAQRETEWVIVSTGMFMSFLFERVFGVVDVQCGDAKEEQQSVEEKKAIVRALGSWTTEVTVTIVEDIAQLTASIVFSTSPRIRDQIVYVAGETVSYGRVAEIVESVLGPEWEVEREVWDVESLERELAADPDNSLKKYRVVFAKGKGVAWSTERTFNKERGIETVGVEEWARKNLVN